MTEDDNTRAYTVVMRTTARRQTVKIAAIVTLRNGALYEWLRTNRMTGRELAQALGVSEKTISSWLCLRSFPAPSLRSKIEQVTRYLFEDLFPAAFQGMPRPVTRTVVQAVPVSCLPSLLVAASVHDPIVKILAEEAEDVVHAVFDCLTPKEREILRARFGFEGDEQTLEELSRARGVSLARLRQIEAQALRKLSHPAISDVLHASRGDLRHG